MSKREPDDADDLSWLDDPEVDLGPDEYDGVTVDEEEEFLGFLAGDYAADGDFLDFLGF